MLMSAHYKNGTVLQHCIYIALNYNILPYDQSLFTLKFLKADNSPFQFLIVILEHFRKNQLVLSMFRMCGPLKIAVVAQTFDSMVPIVSLHVCTLWWVCQCG